MSYQVTCITDITEAEKAWELLSPKKEVMDTWLYRFLYYQYHSQPLQFYLLARDGNPVALLPLQRQEDALEFFGGKLFYKNRIFAKEDNPDYYKRLLEAVDMPIHLQTMENDLPGIDCQEEPEGYYTLPLDQYIDWQSYVQQAWHGESRKKLKGQMRKIEALGVTIEENNVDDLAIIVELNKQRFGEKSHFQESHRIDYLRDLADHFQVKIVTLKIGGEKVAAGFSVLYNNIYYGRTSGHRLDINNLGKYLILQRIDQAIRCGAHCWESGRRDYGWKERFGFVRHPLYCFYA